MDYDLIRPLFDKLFLIQFVIHYSMNLLIFVFFGVINFII